MGGVDVGNVLGNHVHADAFGVEGRRGAVDAAEKVNHKTNQPLPVMARRILASDALTNWVSRVCSTVFWLSRSISLSRVTVLPSQRPETAEESTASSG